LTDVGYALPRGMNDIRTLSSFGATLGLVMAIFQAKGIDPKLREMINLRAATVLNAPYEWQANTQMATNAGLSAAETDAAASDGRWPASIARQSG
jgi:alkylhydroperoxidase/carboxymuconolactone decarboxylase family protein YurZ